MPPTDTDRVIAATTCAMQFDTTWEDLDFDSFIQVSTGQFWRGGVEWGVLGCVWCSETPFRFFASHACVCSRA